MNTSSNAQKHKQVVHSEFSLARLLGFIEHISEDVAVLSIDLSARCVIPLD